MSSLDYGAGAANVGTFVGWLSPPVVFTIMKFGWNAAKPVKVDRIPIDLHWLGN
jgi:hypothetical protein